MPITTKGYLGFGRETTMTLPMSKEVRFNGKAYHHCFLDVEIKEHAPMIYPFGQEIISVTMRPSLKDEHILSPLIVNYGKTDMYRIRVMDQHLDVLYKRVSTLFPECTGWPRYYEEFQEKPTRKHAKGVRLAVKWGTHEIDAGKVTKLIWLDDEAFRALIQNEIDAYKAIYEK
jgi:hypothetical protein